MKSQMRYEFGAFELQPTERRLLLDGKAQVIGPRAFDLLVALVEEDGRLMTKETLLERVWPKLVVEDNALQAQISSLRKVLGAEAIATVSRSGYRFALPVRRAVAESVPDKPSTRNLPRPATSFVGRDKEIAQIQLLLGRTRLLTLIGAGGCGKTRLAIRVADGSSTSYPDGICFIDLSALADPSLVLGSVALALGVKDQQSEQPLQAIARHLSSERLLLVIDNAEHLAEAVSALTDEMLRLCERTGFLVTSRQPLGVAGELVFRVPSLSIPDPKTHTTPQQLAAFESVQLFVDRARLQRPHFAVTDEAAPALSSLCYRLEGIPLAIELAAPRLRSMSVQEINRRLDQRFGLLTTGSSASSHRQRTLRAMLDWSYDLLSDTEQQLLCRASVFAGGWTLEAAEQVCVEEGDSSADILDLLASLADKSLLLAEWSDGGSRYRMLETVRQYARERLDETGTSTVWQTRHLAHYLAVAEEIAPNLVNFDAPSWHERLELEHENMRAALAWSSGRGKDPDRGLSLATALWRFWLRGRIVEGLATLRTMLESTANSESTAGRAAALHGAGQLAYHRGETDAGKQFEEDSLAIYRHIGDKPGVAQALVGMGMLSARRGNYAEAQSSFQEALVIRRESGDRRALAALLSNVAVTAQDMGNVDEAMQLTREVLAIRRELGDRWGTANSLLNMSAFLRDRGDLLEAKTTCEESLVLWREIGDLRGAAYCLGMAGVISVDQSDFAAAERSYREALPILMEAGDQHAISLVIWGLGCACGLINGIRAAHLWGAAEKLNETIGAPRRPAGRERDVGRIAAARAAHGDDDSFDQAWQEGRALTLQQAVDLALEVGP